MNDCVSRIRLNTVEDGILLSGFLDRFEYRFENARLANTFVGHDERTFRIESVDVRTDFV
ncbi:hypothetical protein NKF26_13705 [Haladaptatus sp. AB618]|nr:hypothetical protein [Haladaptatus sp. AB618]MCO8254855.1 hypothetical protein [Haladaptatus sp. AB618]